MDPSFEDFDLESFRLAECLAVNLLNSTAAQCAFIRTRTDCSDAEGLFNYAELFYCYIGAENKFNSIFLSFLWLLILFTGLGVTADDFLCPSLLVISKTLKLSQNVAGVTFLAFGNGAPDIFSSLAGIRQARPELVIGELFGAGIFVTTVVTGCIILTQGFKMMEMPLMRDLFMYMLATFLTWFICWEGSISIAHAIAFMLIYVIYIVIVIVGQVVKNRSKSSSVAICPPDIVLSPELIIPSHTVSRSITLPSSYPCLSTPTNGSFREGFGINQPLIRRRTLSHSRHLIHHHLDNAIYSITHSNHFNEFNESCEERSCSSDKGNSTWSDGSSVQAAHSYGSRRPSAVSVESSDINLASQESRLEAFSEWRDFFVHICPIDVMEWADYSIFSKFLQVWKAPIYFLLTISSPVVDYESHRHNWSRILNCFHCISGPVAVLLLTGNVYRVLWGTIPLVVIVVFVGLLAAISVFLTSRFEEPPKYHWVFGYLGFIVSVFWIYGLANEVVDLLQAIGIMFNLSDSILGLTVLAWGNSLGDLIANVSMARQGFPRMAISACFGGPLLNLLLGIGLPYTIMLAEEGHDLRLEYSRMVSLLYSTITLSLVSTVIIMLITNFEAKRAHGLYLIGLYLTYLTFAILLESQVL